jgi:SAM-dependent methyltransferase
MTAGIKKLQRVCPICECDRGLVLHHQTFVLPDKHPLRNGYDVALCGKCKFLFADSSVTQHDYDVYYSDFSKYEDNHTSTGGGESGFDSARIEGVARQIATTFHDKSLRILDVGCANGGILKKLKEIGFLNIVGVDPSQACVNYIKNQLSIEAHKASLFDMPRSLEKFDLIILSHVMEHILNLRGCISEVSKFLNDRGHLYVEVPNAMRYVDFITSPFQDFNTEHINHFTQVSLDNLFENSGFVKLSGGIKTIESAPFVPYPALYTFYRKEGDNDSEKFISDEEIENKIKLYIHNSQSIIDNINNFLDKSFARDENIMVWGTGQLTMKLLALSDLRFLHIQNFIDSNPILSNKFINGVSIKHPSQLTEVDPEVKILITSTIHEMEILKDITEKYNLRNPTFGLRDCLKTKL